MFRRILRDLIAAWWGVRAMIWAAQWTFQGVSQTEIERRVRERMDAVLAEIRENADKVPRAATGPGMHPSGGTPDMPYTDAEVKAGKEHQAELRTRAHAVKTIKAALRKVTGRTWSVRGGTGTSYGYIDVTAPKARLDANGSMTEDDMKMLRDVFGVDVHHQGLMLPGVMRRTPSSTRTGGCVLASGSCASASIDGRCTRSTIISCSGNVVESRNTDPARLV